MSGANNYAANGIVVYRASRLEVLLDPLMSLMDSAPPVDVLAPYTLVAAHPGIKQWLERALARKRGVGGIVANVEIQLPSAALDELARQVLGESMVALRPYRREALRWSIHEILGEIDAPQIIGYLSGNDVARRRFQLADRLARIYTRYLVYRPDWLKAWAEGRDDAPEATFLAPLWRSLRARIGLPHRGELLDQVIAQLRSDEIALSDEPLHVFGISHLAPTELATLRALSRRRLVVLYVPDPCIEYWAGLRSDLSRLQALAKLDALPTDAEQAFLEQDHPLLASWGRVGQHLMLALAEGGEDVRLDIRHWQDEEVPPQPMNRLLSLQESVRRLKPGLIVAGEATDAIALRDRSLRVHVCHTRLRELEVLRDALLRERLEHPDLKPSDIVVMAPDIQAYVPLLGAVFGEAGKHEGPLPYHLADVAIARQHPVFTAFETLLSIPQSRLTAPEIMDLIEVPEIARALGLDGSDIEVLHGWLQRSRVAWALDPAFRASFGVPAIEEHTFAWGMDRLLGGYVFGESGKDERIAHALPDGESLLPIEGVHGPQAEVIGALDRLLRVIAGLREDAGKPRAASAWNARLEAVIDTLFRADPLDESGREAIDLLRRLVRAIEGEPRSADLDPILDFSVVREVLIERLGTAPERQRFLMGGVTFCGMVPQRAIPFRVIAVLGLNDGDFPRAPSDGGLDLMPRHPRLGDRDVRNDDRYLFLETLMSARDALHLSYVGEGVRDAKPRNPSTPLAELLNLLDECAGLRGADPEVDRAWIVRHPLQAFDRRYFDGSDPRLYSFRSDFKELATRRKREMHPFLRTVTAYESGDATEATIVPLAEVMAYYKDPARQILRNRLHLRLDALEDHSLRDSESLDARFDSIDRVSRRLFLDAVSAANGEFNVPENAPDWLRLDGLWPPGRAGEEAWKAEVEQVESALKLVGEHPLLANGLPRATPLRIDREFGAMRVQGELSRIYPGEAARWVFDVFPGRKEADLTFRDRIGLFLEWALLRLDDAQGMHGARMLVLVAGAHPWMDSVNEWDERFLTSGTMAESLLGDLERRVAALLAFWSTSQAQPAAYFPKTSWEVSGSKEKPNPEQAWSGGFGGVGERDYAPGYAALLARDMRFDEESAERLALESNAQYLLGLISLADAGERTDA